MRREIRQREAQADDHLPADLHPVLRRIYLNRGVGSAKELDLSLKQLIDYKSLKGIDRAVELLASAVLENRHILIVGDFDADGATSTALAIRALEKMGAKCISYIVPDRFKYGYGLTPEIVEDALQQSPDLIITVDNGISSAAGVEAAQNAGIKVLVTDHHLPGKQIPSADAIVNPNQSGCQFPSKKLAGVGVIFYVMAALRAHLRSIDKLPDPEWSMSELLDLVALGTVADVVALDHNNRILVENGLRRIRNGCARPGIKALIQVAQRQAANLTSTDLGFALGPRLNAAGRLQDMGLGIECLLAKEDTEALTLAAELNAINLERRDIQTQMQTEAMQKIDSTFDGRASLPVGLCVYQVDWHEGVVGLVASKLKERHHRPCIAFAPAGDDGTIKGSARSIPGVHIRDILERVSSLNPGLIDKFGGHAMAAGLSMSLKNLDQFQTAFENAINEVLDDSSLISVIDSEGSLETSQIHMDTATLIQRAGPWGQGFPEPVFDGDFEVIDQRILKDKHWKLRLKTTGNSQPLDGIAFNAVTEQTLVLPSKLRVAYKLGINDFRGQQNLQLMIVQMEPLE